MVAIGPRLETSGFQVHVPPILRFTTRSNAILAAMFKKPTHEKGREEKQGPNNLHVYFYMYIRRFSLPSTRPARQPLYLISFHLMDLFVSFPKSCNNKETKEEKKKIHNRKLSIINELQKMRKITPILLYFTPSSARSKFMRKSFNVS